MNNTFRNGFAALTVIGVLALGACKTTDDGMDGTDAPTPAPAEPAPMTPATPTDSSTAPPTESAAPPTGTPTDGTP